MAGGDSFSLLPTDPRPHSAPRETDGGWAAGRHLSLRSVFSRNSGADLSAGSQAVAAETPSSLCDGDGSLTSRVEASSGPAGRCRGWEGVLLSATAASYPGQSPRPDLRPGIALAGEALAGLPIATNTHDQAHWRLTHQSVQERLGAAGCSHNKRPRDMGGSCGLKACEITPVIWSSWTCF